MRRLAAVTLLVLLAGCIKIDTGGAPSGPAADDGVTTLQVSVVANDTGTPLPGAHLALSIPRSGVVRRDSDAHGQATFSVKPAPACSLAVERSGYQTGAIALDCSHDQAFRLPLRPVGTLATKPPEAGVPTGRPRPTVAPPGQFLLSGQVLAGDSGAPLAGITVHLDAPGGQADRTRADGLYAFAVAPGAHTLSTDAPCWIAGSFPVQVDGDLVLDLRLTADAAPPGVPTGIQATGGPGPGMVTVSWQDVARATGYTLLRNGDPIVQLARSRAYGVPGATASDRFAVSARDACGHGSAASAEVSADPLPGVPALTAAPRTVQVTVEEHAYPAYAPDGTPAGTHAWRTVEGTGNCCENYIAVTPTGRILDQGGSVIAYSDDAGRSWHGVLDPLVAVYGEGSVAIAPDGDVVAFDWATYNADTAFSYRYSAATGQWETLPIPKPPFYDRPWIGTIKGPFMVDGLVVPYVTFVQGLTGLLVSLDGLHYTPISLVASSGSLALDLKQVAPDSNRDWIGSAGALAVLPVDNGLGVFDPIDNGEGNVEPAVAVDSDLSMSRVSFQAPGTVVRFDGAGGLHALALEADGFTYSWSRDGGAHWDAIHQDVPGELWQADLRANAALDEAAVAVHVAKADGNDLFRLYRYEGLDEPRLTAVYDLGNSDHPFRGNPAGGGDRFDFMTLGFLPSGAAVLSFGDADHVPPAIAVESFA